MAKRRSTVMMRRTSGDVKSPTKYVIEAFSSPPRRADAVRPGEPVIVLAVKRSSHGFGNP
jgi:hypothetical protein